jgi:hypothetical protein
MTRRFMSSLVTLTAASLASHCSALMVFFTALGGMVGSCACVLPAAQAGQCRGQRASCV